MKKERKLIQRKLTQRIESTDEASSLAYRPGLLLALKNVIFEIKPMEKIGVCGRTGAGKSSIMTVLC